MKQLLAAATLLSATLFSAAALAGGCPGLMAQIDNKLEKAELSDAKRTEVKALREAGEHHHHHGDHGDAMDALNEALAMLED